MPKTGDKTSTPGGRNDPDRSRRRLLRRVGLAAVALYATPALSELSRAEAKSGRRSDDSRSGGGRRRRRRGRSGASEGFVRPPSGGDGDLPLLEDILRRLGPDMRHLVRIEPEYEDGRRMFEIKYIDRSGRLIEVYVDAETGDVLEWEVK